MGIHVQRRRGVAVAEPAGNRSHVDTGTQKSRRDVVTKVVEADAVQADAAARLAEPA
jgi:hypothetical protein